MTQRYCVRCRDRVYQYQELDGAILCSNCYLIARDWLRDFVKNTITQESQSK